MPKRILYCVLDWGLGHATRSIPIIQALLERGCDVVLASDSLALEFLRSEYSSLNSYELPSYDVEYKSANLILNGILNLKGIRSAIKVERGMIRIIAAKEKVDIIISDNRYGCYVSGIPAVLITHQLQFRTGSSLQDSIGKIMITKLLKPFDRIWIPDDEERTLSGVLSKSEDHRLRCIGWQSTLTKFDPSGNVYEADNEDKHRVGLEDVHYDERNAENMDVPENAHMDGNDRFTISAILSGPEPMRSTFEVEIRQQFESLNLNCALVRGVQGNDEAQCESNITVYDVLDRNGINRLINSSSIILCRSGYSSLMDLRAVGAMAILIPTPGQPEQKYLGERMKSIPNFIIQQQGALNMKSAIKYFENFNQPQADTRTSHLLDNAIEDLIKIG